MQTFFCLNQWVNVWYTFRCQRSCPVQQEAVQQCEHPGELPADVGQGDGTARHYQALAACLTDSTSSAGADSLSNRLAHRQQTLVACLTDKLIVSRRWQPAQQTSTSSTSASAGSLLNRLAHRQQTLAACLNRLAHRQQTLALTASTVVLHGSLPGIDFRLFCPISLPFLCTRMKDSPFEIVISRTRKFQL